MFEILGTQESIASMQKGSWNHQSSHVGGFAIT